MRDLPSDPADNEARCTLTRLAESSVATVDRCACGVIQLHLGALTLRFAPSAAFELLATLGDAMTRHTAHGAGSPNASVVLPGPTGRGQA
jgi:hypothetical protein